MNQPTLPLGARTPDEVLAAAQDPGLSPADRRAVEQWLLAHPEWQPLMRSYAAIRIATQQPAVPVDPRPPDVASMTGLWAAINAEPQLTTPTTRAPDPSPAHAPFAPPIALAAERRRRRGSGRWLVAAAAVVVGAGTVVLVDRDGGGSDSAGETPNTELSDVTVEPPTTADESVAADEDTGAADAPGSPIPEVDADEEPSQAALVRLQEGAAATSTASTADVEFRSIATIDVAGTELGDLAGSDVVTFETVGRGQMELPDRAILTTVTTTLVGGEVPDYFPPDSGIVVEDGDRTFVRCAGEADYRELADDEATDCMAMGVGPETFGPEAAIDLIEQESFASASVVEIGTDTMPDGSTITGYQTTQQLDLEPGQTTDVTLQIWIDDESVFRRLIAGGDFVTSEDQMPATLVIAYDLNNYGTVVDIPDLD